MDKKKNRMYKQNARYGSLDLFLEGKEGYGFNKEDFRSPWEYDFKYEYHNQGEESDTFWNLDEESDAIKRIFNYYENANFDCDGSGEKKKYQRASNNKIHIYFCYLTREIYRVLWGWNEIIEKNKFESPNFDRRKLEIPRYDTSDFDANVLLGPETMNSFKTIYNACYKNDDFKGLLEEHAINTHCIGNFILVPAYFNQKRGISGKIKDYWDLSLDYLKSNGFRDLNYKREWKSFCKKDFNLYVNIFFLWDYVDKQYNPKSLCGSKFNEEKNDEKVGNNNLKIPGMIEEKKRFLGNTNWLIRRRGIFMIAMLKLSKINLGSEENMYEKIMQELLMKNEKIFEGCEHVLKQISEWIEKSHADLDAKNMGKKIISDAYKEVKN